MHAQPGYKATAEECGQAKPVISVTTVARNGKNAIERMIRSVLDQGCEGIEYIVVDGASTDSTIDIIKKYEDKLTALENLIFFKSTIKCKGRH